MVYEQIPKTPDERPSLISSQQSPLQWMLISSGRITVKDVERRFTDLNGNHDYHVVVVVIDHRSQSQIFRIHRHTTGITVIPSDHMFRLHSTLNTFCHHIDDAVSIVRVYNLKRHFILPSSFHYPVHDARNVTVQPNN